MTPVASVPISVISKITVKPPTSAIDLISLVSSTVAQESLLSVLEVLSNSPLVPDVVRLALIQLLNMQIVEEIAAKITIQAVETKCFSCFGKQ